MYPKRPLCIAVALALIFSIAPLAWADETTGPSETTVPAETTEPTEQSAPETEPTAAQAEEPQAVGVAFLCRPEALTLTVFAETEGGRTVLSPKGEDPRIYSLLPGRYLYRAICDGYVPVLDAVLEIPPSAEPVILDITLEAIAEQTVPDYYTVTFDPCGGTCSVTTAVARPGGTLGPLPIPSREGYAFVGWYQGECYCDPFQSDSPVDRDQALLAHWAKTSNDGLAVTFDANGGTLPQALFTAQARQVNTGSTLSVYDWSGASVSARESRQTMAVAADGRCLGAELTVPEGGLLIDSQTDPATGRPSDGTAFVAAIPDGSYIGFDYETRTLSVYDSRDGLLAHHSFVESGSPYGPLPTPTREGYTFTGWYTEPLGGTPVAEQTVFSGDTAPVLFAHWKQECAHVYTSQRQEATCQDPLTLRYTCSKCGDGFDVSIGGSWSEWSIDRPWGVAESLTQKRTEYRFQYMQTAVSLKPSMPGWQPLSTEQTWGDYGAWSDWSLTPAVGTDAVQAETALLYRYGCFRCGRCGARNPYPGACGCDADGSVWQEVWHPTPYAQCAPADVPGSEGSLSTTALGDGLVWYFARENLEDTALMTCDPAGETPVIRLGFRTRTRQKVPLYRWYRWTDWSDWREEGPAPSQSLRVESRTVYRRYTGPLAEHTYENGKCTVCGRSQ